MQQAEVLNASGIPSESLCGDLCQERWGLKKWQQICESHLLAIVMTPDACVFSLMHMRLKVRRAYFFPRSSANGFKCIVNTFVADG